MADLSGKTLDELRTEFISLGNQLSVLSAQRNEYTAEIAKRVAAVSAKVRIDMLDKNEKDALRMALGEPLQSKPDNGK